MDNSVTLIGNATREPELRYTPAGKALCKFGMAVNRRWQNSAGTWEEATSFFDVAAWGTMGENVADSIAKGDRVIVAGTMEQSTYETESGEKRSRYELKATDVGLALRFATGKATRNTKREPVSANGAPAVPAEEEPF